MVIEGARQDRAEVDHFLPHALKEKCQTFGPEIDSIWNLVLACNRCNAGEGGKSAKIPSISLLERLHARNNDLIESYHPLRETLMQQTGMTERKRRGFLNEVYDRAKRILIHTWDPKDG